MPRMRPAGTSSRAGPGSLHRDFVYRLRSPSRSRTRATGAMATRSSAARPGCRGARAIARVDVERDHRIAPGLLPPGREGRRAHDRRARAAARRVRAQHFVELLLRPGEFRGRTVRLDRSTRRSRCADEEAAGVGSCAMPRESALDRRAGRQSARSQARQPGLEPGCAPPGKRMSQTVSKPNSRVGRKRRPARPPSRARPPSLRDRRPRTDR